MYGQLLPKAIRASKPYFSKLTYSSFFSIFTGRIARLVDSSSLIIALIADNQFFFLRLPLPYDLIMLLVLLWVVYSFLNLIRNYKTMRVLWVHVFWCIRMQAGIPFSFKPWSNARVIKIYNRCLWLRRYKIGAEWKLHKRLYTSKTVLKRFKWILNIMIYRIVDIVEMSVVNGCFY